MVRECRRFLATTLDMETPIPMLLYALIALLAVIVIPSLMMLGFILPGK